MSEKKSIFLKEIDKALNSENEGITDSDDERDLKKKAEASEKQGGKTTNILKEGAEANLTLLLSPQKYHTHLLNSMNIRADEKLSDYFFSQLKESESEDEEKREDQDKESYVSREQDQPYEEGEGDQDDQGEQDQEEPEPSQDDVSSRQESEDKSKNRESNQDQDYKTQRSDMNMERGHRSRKKKGKFVDPFENLPMKGADMNYSSNYLQMSLATLVLNDHIQKLSEGNNRLKAKIHCLEKQMKTNDPVKKETFSKQLEELSKPGTLKSYLINDTYPDADGSAYKGDKEKFEKYKKAKIEAKSEIEKGFLNLESLKANELPDTHFPGLVYQGSRYIGTTFTKNKEEADYFEASPKSDHEQISQNFGSSHPSNMSGRKRRYRRRANQISRSYLCPLTTCRKAYGSEGSLNQHMKIKHPEYYQNSDMPGRRRGRIGNRHIGFLGPMQPPPPMNQFKMMQNQYPRY